MRNGTRVFRWMVLGWLVGAGLSLQAEDVFLRPIPADGGPTKVYVAMGILDIDEVDSAEQNFTANLFFSARWHDARLVHDEPGRRVYSVDEVWNPRILFVNQQKIWPTLPEVVYVDGDGRVEYSQRVWGSFSQPMEMRDFPFDTQNFVIQLAVAGLEPSDIIFEQDPETSSGLAPKFSLPDWEILGWKMDFSPYRPFSSSRSSAGFALTFRAKRYATYYITKIILPLIMIVGMSWIVFWIDPKSFGTQIGLASTSMLTLIAYRFMVGGLIPVISYPTRMDVFIMGATVIVFLALIQASLTSILYGKGREELAVRMDWVCRFIFPAAFAGLTYFSLIAG